MLRRPTTLSVLLVVLAVTLSGCLNSDWFRSLPGLTPNTVSLQGTVFHGHVGGSPVAGAEVTVGDESIITGPGGGYSFSGLEVKGSTVSVTVEAPGYHSKTMRVAVEAGKSVVLDIAIVPLGEEPGDDGDDVGDGDDGDGNEEPPPPEYDGSVAVSVRLRNASSPAVQTASATETFDVQPVVSPASLRRTAAETYVAGEWIVELDTDYPVQAINAESADEWADVGVRLTERLADNYYLVVADDVSMADEIEERLAALPNVLSVGRNQRVFPVSVAVTPNDEYYFRQWSLPLISAPYAWNITTGQKDVVVAVLDTGLRDDHPDIDRNAIVPGRNFVTDQTNTNYRDNARDLSHGTMVAGIIGAKTNNGTGVAGLNWSVSIMPVRVLSSSGGGSVAGVGQGIRWAVDNGAHVINMSLAWDANTGDPGERFVNEQIEYAISRGVILVAGAGNDNGRITMPAAHPDVIAVGAVDKDKRRAWYSNYGRELDVVAPGGSQSGSNYRDGVLSTDVVNGTLYYSYQQGTSFASPHVAGVVALMYSAGITDVDTIREILADTAEDLGPRGFDTQYGHGLINAYAAVAGVRRQDAVVGIAEDSGTVRGLVNPMPSGDERIAIVDGVAPGEQTAFAWIDVTDNGILDDGDFAGITRVLVPEDGMVDVDLDLVVFDTLPTVDQQRLLDIVNR